jgi:hypothetical protein
MILDWEVDLSLWREKGGLHQKWYQRTIFVCRFQAKEKLEILSVAE